MLLYRAPDADAYTVNTTHAIHTAAATSDTTMPASAAFRLVASARSARCRPTPEKIAPSGNSTHATTPTMGSTAKLSATMPSTRPAVPMPLRSPRMTCGVDVNTGTGVGGGPNSGAGGGVYGRGCGAPYGPVCGPVCCPVCCGRYGSCGS